MNRVMDRVELQSVVEEHGVSFQGQHVLITGGMGFLGRYFVQFFTVVPGCRVTILDNLVTSDAKIVEETFGSGSQPRIEFVKHDVSKPYNPEDHVDTIVHLAGIASPVHYQEKPLETLDVAVWGTRNMLGLARAHRARMIFMSSSEVYGDPEIVPTPETYVGRVDFLSPRAHYDESKRLGETLCALYANRYGVDVKMIRPFNVFGPGLRQSDRRVLPNLATAVVRKHPFEIYGDGGQTRTYTYATDFLRGALTALVRGANGGVPYNVGSVRPEVSIVDLVGYAEEAAAQKIDYELVTPPEVYYREPRRRSPDLRRIQALGYQPKVELVDGLRKFFAWAREVYT